jgi:hypothetical protein
VSKEIRAWYEDYQREQEKLLAEARDQGRAEGEVEGAAHAVLTVLCVRGIAVPDAARERILAERDLDQLHRWVERAVVATSLDDVLAEPSAGQLYRRTSQ